MCTLLFFSLFLLWTYYEPHMSLWRLHTLVVLASQHMARLWDSAFCTVEPKSSRLCFIKNVQNVRLCLSWIAGAGWCRSVVRFHCVYFLVLSGSLSTRSLCVGWLVGLSLSSSQVGSCYCVCSANRGSGDPCKFFFCSHCVRWGVFLCPALAESTCISYRSFMSC